MRNDLWLGICLLLPALASAEEALQLHAERITSGNFERTHIGGPDAIGGIGDWYLANDVVEIIIDDPSRQHGKLNHGGTIVDAGRRDRKNEDQFARLFPILNLDQRVFLNYDSVSAQVNRAQGWARLTVSGRESVSSLPRGGSWRRFFDFQVPDPEELSSVFVRTEYRVRRGEPFVRITTTIENRGNQAAPIFAYGDVLMRGRRGLRAFTVNSLDPAKSRGFRHPSFDRSNVTAAGDAMAGFTLLSTPGLHTYPALAYAFYAPETVKQGRVPFFGVSDDQVTMMSSLAFEHDWGELSLFRLARAMFKKLPAGESWNFERRMLITPAADVASATDVVWREQGVMSGIRGEVDPPEERVRVHVNEVESGAPVTMIAARKGHYAALLPVGHYELAFHSPQRDVRKINVHVREHRITEVPLQAFENPDYLVFAPDYADEGAFRLIIRGLDETPDPVFEPELVDFRIDGRTLPSATETNELYFIGHLSDPRRVALRPGRYRLTGMRGLGYDVQSSVLEVNGSDVDVPPLLPGRAVHLPEFLSADFHVHSAASDDTNLAYETRLKAFVADDVQVFAGTDHENVPEYEPAIRRLALRKRLQVMPASEITSSAPSRVAPWAIGHTNAWPISRKRTSHRRGAAQSQNLTLPDLYANLRRLGAEVVQMNHPRENGVGQYGYFYKMGKEGARFDPHKSIYSSPNNLLLQAGSDQKTRAIDFDTIELMNGPSYSVYLEVREDLYSLLKQGFARPGVGVSDAHGPLQRAVPRSYVYYPPGLGGFDRSGFNAAVREGRLFCTTGPLITRFLVDGAGMGELVATREDQVRVELRIEAARWVPVEEVRVLVNGEVVHHYRDLANKTVRLEENLSVPIEHDSFITLEAGAPLDPEASADGLYAELLPGFVPAAFANPIYIDHDGNGQFDPPGL